MGSFEIVYGKEVEKDLIRLDNSAALRVLKAIEHKLTTEPDLYGLPLRATLKGFWRLRVGDWRVIYEIVGNKVYILAIGHRSDVYRELDDRPRS